uniref:Uncharacterized protein n=1 Tax=Chromera velia CCMP2878 TaxID=1169474 RepID=A0A0G4GGD4_9ALVE|eukprot:Cvel_21773.t1-p1 / transcript=Cvel_21773.t1 / gene=Cvel_21773 / organism=Chromera_velia_CCMP2878 / gene_product=hypothetical protein / transcript_product=hypothetical protein / location=Cvel_scaffold2072:5656-7614(+) / protein_length=653 / sequence_SO=supercontig / SO=protein_coding / is_pseudo=false
MPSQSPSRSPPVSASVLHQDLERGEDVIMPCGCSSVPPLKNLVNLFLDTYSALVVVLSLVLNWESLFYSGVAVAFTLCYFYLFNGAFHANLNWTVVSFSVVFPLTTTVQQAFRRRDEALRELAHVKALVHNMYLGCSQWDWFEDRHGRTRLPSAHSEGVRKILHGLVRDFFEYLRHPVVSKAKHAFTSCGRAVKTEVENLQRQAQWRICRRLREFTLAVEVMKREGLPGNEAARLNQYLMMLETAWERIRNLKDYRTPQALRSFIRVSFIFIPAFYGPYYVHIIGSSNNSTTLAFASAYSVLTAMILCALFQVALAMEDPFDRSMRGWESVKLEKEMSEVMHSIDMATEGVRLSWAYVDASNPVKLPLADTLTRVPPPKSSRRLSNGGERVGDASGATQAAQVQQHPPHTTRLSHRQQSNETSNVSGSQAFRREPSYSAAFRSIQGRCGCLRGEGSGIRKGGNGGQHQQNEQTREGNRYPPPSPPPAAGDAVDTFSSTSPVAYALPSVSPSPSANGHNGAAPLPLKVWLKEFDVWEAKAKQGESLTAAEMEEGGGRPTPFYKLTAALAPLRRESSDNSQVLPPQQQPQQRVVQGPMAASTSVQFQQQQEATGVSKTVVSGSGGVTLQSASQTPSRPPSPSPDPPTASNAPGRS